MRISHYLRIMGIEISVARRGCPWENGYAERLIRTLKEEEVYLNAYDDIHEARVSRIGHFIPQVYNHKRPHSALEYLTPVEFEQKTCLNFANFWSELTLALQLLSVNNLRNQTIMNILYYNVSSE